MESPLARAELKLQKESYTAFKGREYEELYSAMGPISRCIPAHCHFDQAISFRQQCVEMNEWIEDALEWQEYFRWEPSGQSAGGNEHSSFVPLGFEFVILPVKQQVADLTFSVAKQSIRTDPFHLKLTCSQTDKSLTTEFQYDSNRFALDDIRRLEHEYHKLLENALEDPHTAVDQLDILSQPERTQILVEFNDTKVDYGKDLCVHQLIEKQAVLGPDTSAVVYEDEVLTYGELNDRANCLAAYLHTLGIGVGVTVAVRMERSVDMIVGILGILKAGGAYVPLDPSLPPQRANLLIKDSQAPVMLTQQRLVESLPECTATVVVMDEEWEMLTQQRRPAGATGVTPADLVYAIFTSGSTGRPKGVLVEHQQLVNYVLGVVDRLDVPTGAHFATVSTIAADLGNTAIFAALCTGGCLHVIAQTRLSDPDSMSSYFARRPIDCLKIVPSHLDVLLASSHPQHVASCQRIVLGGEASSWDLIERLEALSPESKIFNHYGPTEATVGVSVFPLNDRRADHQGARVPIGRPLSNCQIYLLDANSKPVPIGVAGELHIAGEGLARGYLDRPQQTARQFVPNPFNSQLGARLYKTGDLARYLPGGSIEFLGRLDHQVKIRGFRIELGEIETVLTEHASVHEAVVLARQDAPNDKRLVAYVVSPPGRTATSGELRNFMKTLLPDYMVPAVVVMLERMPLTRNGKVDRRSLPEPDRVEHQSQAEMVSPRTPSEEKLAQIWLELLQIQHLSIHDDFFELGGHSLSAMQLVSRIRKAFQLELSLLSVFESPTVAGLAEQIDQASGDGTMSPVDGIRPVARSENLPASFSQERLWLFDQLNPGNSAYNIPAAIRLTGPLDVMALAQTINEILRRHEVLRTTFDLFQGSPMQVIAPVETWRPCLIDLRDLPPAQQDTQLKSLLNEEAQRSFDLAKGPVWRARVLRIRDQEHVVLWTQHHISSDGWSSSVFMAELSTLYRAFSTGTPVALSEPVVQYADYSHWQRNWLQGEAMERQVAYWKEQLAGAPPALALQTDRPRPVEQSFRGGEEALVLTKALSRALVTLGQKEKATTFITLLAAFKALLFLHTGQEDIVVGSPIAGRSQAETESLIGFFLNTLALRTKVNGEASFRQMLHHVRQDVLGAFSHQDLPFERIVEELQVERDSSRALLYQVMFNMQKAGQERLTFPGLRIEQVVGADPMSKFDLTLYAEEGNEQTTLRMAYNSDLFDGTTIRQMLSHFQVLLEAVVSDPDRRVSELPLLTEAERAIKRSCGVSSYPLPSFVEFKREDIELSISGRFERQVEAHGADTSVKTRTHEWTYERLNEEANRVAQRVLTLNGRSDQRVGLLFNNDAPLIAGIMGVLKAGKTYVPLDPSNPKDRLAYMLQDSQASVILTDNANLSFARELAVESVGTVNVEDGNGMDSQGNVSVPVSPEALAYILYTSGSTGQPKGVVQIHRNVLHFIRVYTNNLGISPEDRLSLLSSYGFDGAIMDIFGALLNGGRLCPMNLREEGLEGTIERLTSDRITIYHSTPTVFRQLIGSLSTATGLPDVRTVVLGGEEALAGDVRLYQRCFSPACVFVNGLGPSESTVTLQHFSESSTENTRTSVPVGFPVEDTDVLLLDGSARPVEVYGEIAIRSPHVALGYWNNPEATEAAFMSDPDGGDRRIYRTGDLGRRLPDGSLEFAGRRDSQVKIRGFRIELREIETVLGHHPAVGECAVLARQDPQGLPRLVAYVQPVQHGEAATPELRDYLKQKLPDYMVPTDFVSGQSLPLTPNGKLDRAALPEPDEARPVAEAVVVAPRTPFEEIMADLWIEVLPVEQVSVFDNFFELGGHSLLAMAVISRIRKTFQIEVPLRTLFESPTLADIARSVEKAKRAAVSKDLAMPPLKSIDRQGEVPLSFAQQRMWILDQLDPGGYSYNVPAAVTLAGPLHLASLEQAMNQIVGRHEVLRTTFGKSAMGGAQQTIGEAGCWTQSLVDLSSLTRKESQEMVGELGAREAARPFDLSRGPLFRMTLVRLDEQQHVALFTMHHIVSDAWSTSVLVGELSELYGAFSSGRSSQLPNLTVQYVDFADWQRRWLQGEVLQTQLAYWKEQLRDIPSHLYLPADRPRPARRTQHGAKERFHLPKDKLDSLRELSRTEGATLFMTLLAAFQTLLYRYTGQVDIVVGAPIAGRTLPETEDLIGFFVNTLVLRNRVDSNHSFRQFIKEVRETVLGATTHQDLPFERLVDELQPARDMGRTPLFQVAFLLENTPKQALDMAELTLGGMKVETRTAKFDWSLAMVETENGLSGYLEYSTDLFNAQTIRRVLGHFETLLGVVAADPEKRLADLPLLTELERDQLLVQWNDTQADRVRGECIQEMFEGQVERTPEAVAAVCRGQQLTYGELNARANQLGRHLQRLGVGPEVLVGICMERSLEMVVGLLAILKAGGAYLPLDPEYPKERLAFMLEDAQAQVVLTDGSSSSLVQELSANSVCVDEAWPVVAEWSRENLVGGASTENLAYVIYTSGSTGRPKGVEIEHSGLMNLVEWHRRRYDVSSEDRATLLAALSFDASVWELWPYLASGASVRIAPQETRVSAPRLLEWLAAEAATICFVPTPLAEAALAEPLPTGVTLRTLLTGGDRLHRAPTESLPFALVNHYGPTENTVVTTCAPVTAGSGSHLSPPIGRPIDNTQVYLLDSRLQPVPAGVAGELYIGGEQLARAYLRRPGLTSVKFIPNPFNQRAGARFYRTGDLARWLPDGNLDFLERMDHQVKVRGFRIELGEIETLLGQQESIKEAAVIAREDSPGDKRLVAYLVGQEGDNPSIGDLRGVLRQQLPEYMIPAAFVILDALPLSATGKVDRQALRAPVQEQVEDDDALAPSTPAEVAIAEIWKEVLNWDQISVNDRFFDLGGYSLIAVQVITRLEKEHSWQIQFRDLLFQTLGQIAAACEKQDTTAGPS